MGVRVEILVKPGSRRPGVGGSRDGALIVRVAEPADRGRATISALRSIAESFGLPPSHVTLVQGPTSRKKVVALTATGPAADEEHLRARLQELLHVDS